VAVFIRAIGLLTTVVVLVFFLRGQLGFKSSEFTLFVLMLTGVMGLLIRLSLLRVNTQVWRKRQLLAIRSHVYLHFVPFCYLALALNNSPSLSMNLQFYLPVAAFFYSGRRTWQAFFGRFRSKIYKLFYLGNTGMFLTLSLLLVLGLVSQQASIIAAFEQLFMLYFSVHLLIVGAVVIKIEGDINTYRSVE